MPHTIRDIAAALGAEACDIYSDVDGIYSADPRIVPSATKLAEEGISAKVIDPRTLVPLDVDLIVESAARTGRVVIADLVLTFAIPTQLSNSVLVEEGDGVLVLPVLLNGVLGVLVGRLTLLYTGSLGDVRRALLISFSLYTVVAVVAVPAVVPT